jgi:mannose-1-phosphate guanylyltransferase
MKSSPDDPVPGAGPDVLRHLWTVILAGGIGSRFWPASTPSRPKQLLPLGSEQPLIRDTVERILPLVPAERLRILTGGHLGEPILRALPELGPGNLLLEPRAAGTAPVLAWAAAEIERRDPDAVMISLHADHMISPAERFRDRLALTARLAAHHRRLFTLGVPPDRPETGYGYIRVGAPLGGGTSAGDGAFQVASFVEKPDLQTARGYLEHGGYLWNSGLFVWRVVDLLDQLERHTPELAQLIPLLREGGTHEFFERVPNLSIDQGLLERSDRVAVMPADFNWDDIGAWDAILRSRAPDDRGNAVVGEAYPVDSRDTVLYAEDGPIVAFGVQDLVIVRTAGVTFVTPRSRVADMKHLLENLPERLRRLD